MTVDEAKGCPDENELAAYVDSECLGDRAKVQAHLEHCQSCESLLAEYVRGITEESDASPERYRLELLLGRGAMGSIYRAYDRELKRSVALKFLHSQALDRQSTDQMLQKEAIALAKLTHPNVVAVYELGVMEGRSYVAMEYVPGQTLDAWLGATSRSWQEIATALLQAGKGLAAAHQAEIIHRDIKPSNILIGEDGRVRLVDFGLARASAATQGGAVGNEVSTISSIAGTPAYMAPELLAGQRAAELSDQYSYALTFFEALTGSKNPNDGSDFQGKAPASLLKVLQRGTSNNHEGRYANVTALNSALNTSLKRDKGRLRRWYFWGIGAGLSVFAAFFVWYGGGDSEQIAGCGEEAVWSDTRPLGKGLSDDSSPIRHALEKSIERFGQDWQLHIQAVCENSQNEAPVVQYAKIECLHGEAEYVHNLIELVDTLSVDKIAMARETVVGIVQQRLCDSGENLLEKTPPPDDLLHRATLMRLRSEWSKLQVMVDMEFFAQVEARAIQLYNDAKLLKYAPFQAKAGSLLGLVYFRLYKSKEASVVLEEAYYQAEIGGATAAKMDIASFMMLVELRADRVVDAERWAEAAKASMFRIGAKNNTVHAAVLATLQGLLALKKGQYQVALEAYQLALQKRQEIGSSPGPIWADLHANIASCYGRQGKMQKSLDHREQMLEILIGLYGEGDLHTAEGLLRLGIGYYEVDKSHKAAQTLNQAIEIWTESSGDHWQSIAYARSNLANVHSEMGRYREAEEAFKQLLNTAQAHEIEKSQFSAITLMGMAVMYLESKQNEKAIRTASNAIEMWEALSHDKHPLLAGVLVTRGAARLGLGQWALVEIDLRRSLVITLEAHGEDSPLLAGSHLHLGLLALARNRLADAKASLQTALRLADNNAQLASIHHALLASIHRAFAEVAWRQGRNRQSAQEHLNKASEVLGEVLALPLREEITEWTEIISN